MPKKQPTMIKATPEQEKQYKQFVKNARKILSSKGKQLLQHINTQDPIDGIAEVSVMILDRIESAAIERKMQLDPDVEIAVMNVVVGEVINLYEKQSGEKLSDEQRYQAFSMALAAYIDNALKTGKIEQNELEAAAQAAQNTPEGAQVAQAMGASQGTPQGTPQGVPQQQVPETGLLG